MEITVDVGEVVDFIKFHDIVNKFFVWIVSERVFAKAVHIIYYI